MCFEVRQRKKIKHQKLLDYVKPDKQVRKSDALFQKAGKLKYPKSIISGEPTQVIHHWIFKSQATNTRYDLDDNAIPLTIVEHDIIHNRTKRSVLETQITLSKGEDWQRRILDKSTVFQKMNEEFVNNAIYRLEAVIERLNETS